MKLNKRIILIAVAVLVSIATWVVAQMWLAGSDIFSYESMVAPTIVFTLFAAVVPLVWLLLRPEHTQEPIPLNLRAGLNRKMSTALLIAFLVISAGFYLGPISKHLTVRGISTAVGRSVPHPALRGEVETQVQKWLGPYAVFIPPIVTLGLFLALWSVSFVFRLLGLWLAMLIFFALRRTGFVKVEQKEVKAEVVTL